MQPWDFPLHLIYNREVLLLHYYNDLSVKEIADVLSQSEGTVKSRLKRGREKLKSIIGEELNDERG
jgi:RNA polymerase sigma-70 factor (ECF subfamily)